MGRTNVLLETQTPVETEALKYNLAERWEAGYDLAVSETFVSKLYRDNRYDELEQNDAIGIKSPEELNEMFPNVEVPFTKPTSYLLANEINEEATEKRRLQDIISNEGRSDSLGITFFSGLGAHATDPIEAGADLLIGLTTGGLGIAAKHSVKFGKQGKRAFKMLKRSRDALKYNPVKTNIAEGIISQVALEPQFMKFSERSQEDYTIQDATISVIGGGIVFPLGMAGVSKGIHKLVDSAPWTGQAVKTAVSQIRAGKRPDLAILDSIRNTHLNAKSGAPKGTIRSDFEFRKIQDGELKERNFYVSTVTAKNTLDYTDHHTVGGFMGDEGIHITDNPNMANQYANDPMSDTLGNVHQVNLKNSNLLNLQEPTTTLEGANISNMLKEIDPELDEAFRAGYTIKEGLDNVAAHSQANKTDTNAVLKQVHNTIKKNGYDGTVHTEAGKANHAYIYDPESLNHRQSFKADKKTQAVYDKKVEQQAAKDTFENPEREIFHSKATQNEIDSTPDLSEEQFKTSVEDIVNTHRKEVDELVDSGFATQNDLEIKKALDMEDNLQKGKNSVFQRIKNCLMGGL